MVGRALRTALVAAVTVALWICARPAHAAFAPFCDDRGASALASPPALEAPDVAVRRALFSNCDRARVEFGLTVRAHHDRVSPRSDDSDRGWWSQTILPLPAPNVILVRAQVSVSACFGARARVERPPRT